MRAAYTLQALRGDAGIPASLLPEMEALWGAAHPDGGAAQAAALAQFGLNPEALQAAADAEMDGVFSDDEFLGGEY